MSIVEFADRWNDIGSIIDEVGPNAVWVSGHWFGENGICLNCALDYKSIGSLPPGTYFCDEMSRRRLQQGNQP
jgi:hypothetical protein